MIRSIVSRNDDLYECFPDVALCDDGTLVCVYRECMFHAPFPFSRLVCRRSLDGGQSWLRRQIIDECVVSPELFEESRSWLSEEAIAGYEETRARVTDARRVGASMNCPRLLRLHDGQLLMVVDYRFGVPQGEHRWVNLFYRSFDSGATWRGPEDPGVHDALVPSLAELRDGGLILGLARETGSVGGLRFETQFVYFSEDQGTSWSEPVPIPALPTAEQRIMPGYRRWLGFGEGCFVELEEGTILGILRADSLGQGYKVLSKDRGRTWSGPFATQMIGLEGRPKVGLLSSGEVCCTYRIGLPNEMLALHLMTQEGALLEDVQPTVPRLPLPEDRAGVHDPSQPWYMREYYPGCTIILDQDRSVHRDCGYSGWVELPNGDLYVVDYCHDDASRAHIRSYRVSREDIILFPPGEVPWLHPSGQPFLRMTQGMAARQFQRNRT